LLHLSSLLANIHFVLQELASVLIILLLARVRPCGLEEGLGGMEEGKDESLRLIHLCFDFMMCSKTHRQITDLCRRPPCASAPRAAPHRTHNAQHARKEGQKFDATAVFAQPRV